MGIRHNPWLAWQFDNAIALFGHWVEARLSERDEKNRPKHRLEKLLKLPGRKANIQELANFGVPVTRVAGKDQLPN